MCSLSLPPVLLHHTVSPSLSNPIPVVFNPSASNTNYTNKRCSNNPNWLDGRYSWTVDGLTTPCLAVGFFSYLVRWVGDLARDKLALVLWVLHFGAAPGTTAAGRARRVLDQGRLPLAVLILVPVLVGE